MKPTTYLILILLLSIGSSCNETSQQKPVADPLQESKNQNRISDSVLVIQNLNDFSYCERSDYNHIIVQVPKVYFVPKCIKSKNIKQITINNFSDSILPIDLDRFSEIEKLNIGSSHNVASPKIVIDDRFCGLKGLKYLSLSYLNPVFKLECKMPSLEVLTIYYSSLNSFPSEVLEFDNLKRIEISEGHNIDSLPMELTNMPNLEQFVILPLVENIKVEYIDIITKLKHK